ncbi:MAG: hypothetical protein LAQ69_24815 [Acidobacteriia bacterium]|nr:hypothetical protein [Terriglobia bacterium]
MKLQFTLFMLAALCSGFAQTSAIVTGAGYSAPAPFQAAPGQVVTLFLHGVPAAADGTLRSGQAAGTPLPTALAGISLRVTQGQASPMVAPIFAVRQENECGQSDASDPACLLTAVKIEVPFELFGDITPTDTFHYTLAPAAMVRVEVDGRTGRAFPFQPIPDNAHVLTDCDVTWDTKSSSVCNRHIYHADGRIVDEQSPVKASEAVSVYLYGLGQTSPAAQTGLESPVGAAVTDLLGHSRVAAWLQKDFYNALSSSPRAYPGPGSSPDSVPVLITSAGLFRGQVGVYQVNLTLPDVLTSAFPCGGTVHSNALLTIATSQGSEGIALCVEQ